VIPVFETMRVEEGRVRLRARHLARLAASGTPPARVAEAEAVIDEALLLTDQPFLLRVDVADDGVEPSTRPVPPVGRVDLPLHRSYDPADATRLVKAADRAWAERAEAEAGGEPLLVSRDGLIGETTRAAVLLVGPDGAWHAPRLRGILPSVTRAWAIAETGAREDDLHLDALRDAAGLALLTAGRGVVPVDAVEGIPLARSPLVDDLARRWRELP
jgi:branched-subunit amino acid aminotransferase/4-amino-4-deoxychorismate lyase